MGAISLLNDVVVKSNLFDKLEQEKPVAWFADVDWVSVVLNFLLPLIVVVCFAFVLKGRYVKRKERLSSSMSMTMV